MSVTRLPAVGVGDGCTSMYVIPIAMTSQMDGVGYFTSTDERFVPFQQILRQRGGRWYGGLYASDDGARDDARADLRHGLHVLVLDLVWIEWLWLYALCEGAHFRVFRETKDLALTCQ
ncbi:hypothetical protein FOIG_12211 [Fusarium odoratissimum NRRL 54006]|uniref:Uncharacterized protein n=2 Tax=Fusarium oxysporum species complex TaxID=171631 RepID=X0KE73_FUSO5|nr:uncharacterized protein FOIG_12211 [Fusarium odoratissimum NRRL 54006]EXL95259.1 hypothetical protein FOIG_12211 [Fusarium odoratissimum NRRL 54006]TXC10392.1 hypothetical protein FocTR4_00005341 [Fusarium oxysporum f. sp. cubense]